MKNKGDSKFEDSCNQKLTTLNALTALRQLMKSKKIEGMIIPSADPHLSEYLPEYWQVRAWLSGFTGSAGTLIVMQNCAGLWVDSRYWDQASQQLQATGIDMMKIVGGYQQSHLAWLKHYLTNIPESKRNIAIDKHMVSVLESKNLIDYLSPIHTNINFELDLITPIWLDRPALPVSPIYSHADTYISLSRKEKIRTIAERTKQQHATWHIVSTLDDIAWMLNLRGNAVAYNPVFLSHIVIKDDATATLFVNPDLLSKNLKQDLQADEIDVVDYEQIYNWLAHIPAQDSILLDSRKVALALLQKMPQFTFAFSNQIKTQFSNEIDATEINTTQATPGQLIDAVNPSTLLKACKSNKEIKHIRSAMARDGAALCEFFAEFEDLLQSNNALTELDVMEMLRRCRASASQENFVSESFNTIAGFNANGALPHYTATPESHAKIKGNGLLLIDSGGQYLDGTTDITRMMPIGRLSAEQKRDCTLVLKGLISLSNTYFPENIRSPMLDAMARAPLWAQACDYGHGTGHGVGYFLNVHEGPHVISYHAKAHENTALKEGMITSIEPGLYRTGQWGIRIENLVVVQLAADNEFGRFCRFETLTLCPIDSRCLDCTLLSNEDIAWLNNYHLTVCERLLPLVSEKAKNWLLKRTEPISNNN